LRRRPRTSIGVLHHLPEPVVGFRALASLLRPGGRFVAWCYAREGNVLALVDPVRRLQPSDLSDLAVFPFREVHSIAFDQLLAPVAHYMPHSEVERCFAESGLKLASLRFHHANRWAAIGAV
jgi:SAM-dependent methyltransferase